MKMTEALEKISKATAVKVSYIRILSRMSAEDRKHAGYSDDTSILLAIRKQFDLLEKEIQKIEAQIED